jgi:hypothetical protein
MVNLSVIINRFNRIALPLLPGPPLWLLVLMRIRAEVRRAGQFNCLSRSLQVYLLEYTYMSVLLPIFSDKIAFKSDLYQICNGRLRIY